MLHKGEKEAVDKKKKINLSAPPCLSLIIQVFSQISWQNLKQEWTQMTSPNWNCYSTTWGQQRVEKRWSEEQRCQWIWRAHLTKLIAERWFLWAHWTSHFWQHCYSSIRIFMHHYHHTILATIPANSSKMYHYVLCCKPEVIAPQRTSLGVASSMLSFLLLLCSLVI